MLPAHPAALLTESQVADLLGISVRTLQAWRLQGTGPAVVRISARCVRYRNDDIMSFVRDHTEPAKALPPASGDAGGE